MPRTPRYCLHKASGRAYVRIDGKQVYLGPYDSPESRRKYQEILDSRAQEDGAMPHCGDHSAVAKVAANRGNRKSPPQYCLHKPTGRAYVTLNGQRIYLGPHDSRESRQRYQDLVQAFLTARQVELEAEGHREVGTVTIAELAWKYWQYAQGYYRLPNGQPTGQLPGVKIALAWLRTVGDATLAASFGPRALKTLRSEMIAAGHSRRYINDNVDRIRRAYRWATSEEMIPVSVYETLRTVPRLRRGREGTREAVPKGPIADEVVEATLPFVSPQVSELIQLQRLTGARPGEMLALRPADVDRSGEVWFYRPEHHKTAHHGKTREIAIGPRGQRILAPYLAKTEPTERCFPIRRDSYTNAVARGVRRANHARTVIAEETGGDFEEIPHWSPVQLRKAFATEVRQRQGLDAAQVALGHSHAAVTEIYAEANREHAVEVAKALG